METIKEAKKKVEEAIQHTDDVKDGKSTPEEEKQEPGYLLYNQIADTMLEIMQKPEITSAFVAIGKKLGDDVSTNLVNIIAICTVTVAHNAIVFYDDLLKKELTQQFSFFGNHLNECKADVAAFRSVLEVFKKRIDETTKKEQLDQFQKATGAIPDPEA